MATSYFPLRTESIQKLIPHRYPFLLVDLVKQITEEEVGKRIGRVILAQKNVTANEPFFTGHFPGNPIMPGVLIVEAIGQAGALCCCGMRGDPAIKSLFFAGSKNIRFKKPVLPGDVLDIRLKINRKKSNFYWSEGVASVKGEVAVQVELCAYVLFEKK